MLKNMVPLQQRCELIMYSCYHCSWYCRGPGDKGNGGGGAGDSSDEGDTENDSISKLMLCSCSAWDLCSCAGSISYSCNS